MAELAGETSFPNALFAANEREAAPVWVAAAFPTALFAAAVWVTIEACFS